MQESSLLSFGGYKTAIFARMHQKKISLNVPCTFAKRTNELFGAEKFHANAW
jgi:hypothetical protein